MEEGSDKSKYEITDHHEDDDDDNNDDGGDDDDNDNDDNNNDDDGVGSDYNRIIRRLFAPINVCD